MITFTKLKEYTSYIIEVAPVNTFGEGPPKTLIGITELTSKYAALIHFCYLHFAECPFCFVSFRKVRNNNYFLFKLQ